MRSCLLVFTLAAAMTAQTRTELLYPKGTPAAVGSEDVDKPTLAYYVVEAAKSSGTAVVVCPAEGSLTSVKLTGGLLAHTQATNAAVTMPFALDQCETSGRIKNFDLAA